MWQWYLKKNTPHIVVVTMIKKIDLIMFYVTVSEKPAVKWNNIK